MLAVGIPAPVVKHKMEMEGVDTAILDLDTTPLRRVKKKKKKKVNVNQRKKSKSKKKKENGV